MLKKYRFHSSFLFMIGNYTQTCLYAFFLCGPYSRTKTGLNVLDIVYNETNNLLINRYFTLID